MIKQAALTAAVLAVLSGCTVSGGAIPVATEDKEKFRAAEVEVYRVVAR